MCLDNDHFGHGYRSPRWIRVGNGRGYKNKNIIQTGFSSQAIGVSNQKKRHTRMIETYTALPYVVLLVRRGRGHPPTPFSLGYGQRVPVLWAERWKCG